MADSSIIAKTADMMVSGQEAEERRTDYVCVLALVDTTAPKALAIPVRDAFDPRMPTSNVRVVAADSGRDLLAPTIPDVCVAVAGSRPDDLVSGVCELAAAGVPVAIIAESALDVPPMPLGETTLARVSIISATTTEVLLEKLAEWLIDATNKSIAMAANFPFCRKAKVRALTNDMAKETAMNRAKQGPGGEVASVATSQARLALSIAAVNGQPLSLRRVPEVASAIGLGVGSSILANKYLGKVPVVGWILEAGMGYLGAEATGKTLQYRHDKREAKAAKRVGKVVDATGHHVAIEAGGASARRLGPGKKRGASSSGRNRGVGIVRKPRQASGVVAEPVGALPQWTSDANADRARVQAPVAVESTVDLGDGASAGTERRGASRAFEKSAGRVQGDGVSLHSRAATDVRLYDGGADGGYIVYGSGAGA